MMKKERTVWVLKKLERSDQFQHVSVYATRERAQAFMEEDIADTVRRETELEASSDLVRDGDGLGARFRECVEWKIDEMKVI